MVLGAGMGMLGFYFLFDQGAQKYLATMQAAQANSALSGLKRLRSGDTNRAIEHLESELDSALIGLTALYYDASAKKPDTMVQKTLGRVRDYRAKHPREIEDAEVSAAIAYALNLATNQPVK